MSLEDFQGGSNCRFAQPMPSERAAVSGGVPISPWIGGRVGFRVRVRVSVRGHYFLRLHTPLSIVGLVR